MKKDVFITLRVERTLKELLVSEARIKNKSLSCLLRFLVREYLEKKQARGPEMMYIPDLL